MRNNKRNMMNNPRRHNNNNRYHRGNGGGHRNYNLEGAEDSEFVNPRQRKMAMTQREKYMNMGRDAQSSGDRVLAEYYFQHADHYLRIINLANQHNPQFQQQQQGGGDGHEDEGNAGSVSEPDVPDEPEALPLAAVLPAPKGPGRGYDEVTADDDRDAV